ncbi:hypothetical protein F4561_005246 [Lipingzhangella halophila]|uniref:DNA-directed RNA polymerase specialized sigma24 family protein n=1 Tax=Lipingzhangella halophila TaxID=1783352 RepID=A0A7W7W550_9ACTN|nr:hypothetical protein [Lipingzhangella halophila]MBB4934426.1 hypothetical protein [Lipingzhangella halophila]
MVASDQTVGNGRSPLQEAERQFQRLGDQLRVVMDGCDCAGEVSLVQARSCLLGSSRGARQRDVVWCEVIRRARMHEEWMVGAIGLAMPGLRMSARRVCRGLAPAAVDDVESAILAGFVTAMRQINPEWTRLAWRLRSRAQRAGFQERRRETRQPTVNDQVSESAAPPIPWGHPDLLLAEAVRAGVLHRGDAQLIAESRLEKATLVAIAADLDVSYKTLHKRRERAEARLVAAIADGSISARSSTAATIADAAGYRTG